MSQHLFDFAGRAASGSGSRAWAGGHWILAQAANPPAQVVQTFAETFHDFWHFEVGRVGGTPVEVNQIVMAGIIFFVGTWMSSRLAHMVHRRLLARRHFHANAAAAVQKILFYVLLLVVTFTALETVSIPMTVFTVMGGAIAIGVGFGAQNIFNNFISGLILMFEGDIRIGDMVELEGSIGHVADIGARRTRIKRVDGIDLLVPNSALLQNTVVNWTLSDNRARTTIRVGVAYGSPIKRVAELLCQAAREDSRVLSDPAPVVIFEDFGDSALAFDLYFWSEVSTMMDLRVIRSDIHFHIVELMDRNSIVLAFPQRDVHLDIAKPLEVRMVSGQGGEGASRAD